MTLGISSPLLVFYLALSTAVWAPHWIAAHGGPVACLRPPKPSDLPKPHWPQERPLAEARCPPTMQSLSCSLLQEKLLDPGPGHPRRSCGRGGRRKLWSSGLVMRTPAQSPVWSSVKWGPCFHQCVAPHTHTLPQSNEEVRRDEQIRCLTCPNTYSSPTVPPICPPSTEEIME